MVGIEKATRLAPTVEVERIGSSYYFKVHSNEDREVIYKNGKWSCDCEWFSVKGTPCSHVLAARIRLNELRGAGKKGAPKGGAGSQCSDPIVPGPMVTSK